MNIDNMKHPHRSASQSILLDLEDLTTDLESSSVFVAW
jgi:hypothetical protein